MYFYKDSQDLFHIGNSILPTGNYILRKYNNDLVISIESAETHKITMSPYEITNLKKENDTNYIDLIDLLNDVGSFFK